MSTSTLLGNWKIMEHEGDNYTNCDWCFWYSNWRILKGLEELEVGGRKETIQTTGLLRAEKSPGDLRRLAVTQTPMTDYQQTLMWKTLMNE